VIVKWESPSKFHGDSDILFRFRCLGFSLLGSVARVSG